MELTAGQVWWARPDPGVGREQAGRRPVLVLSGDEYHETVTTLVVVAPLTTTDRGWPNHVAVEVLDPPSWAMTEQVRAISRDRLDGLLGVVDDTCLAEARRWVLDYLQ